jgi:predicted transposase YbfD/YdcC
VPATSSSPSPLIGVVEAVPVPVERLSTAESVTLLAALRGVPDPRRRRGRRHGLQSVLLLALGAVMAGARSWAGIAQWAATADHALAVCGRPPSASTFRRTLARVDVTALEAALTRWVLGRRDRVEQISDAGVTAAERRAVVAVDGKTLRGARQPDGRQTKLVCVYDHAHQLVLTQGAVAGGDEITAFTTVLGTLPDLDGVLVTADALHCQRDHVQFLADRGGHYLFTVKANQPLLRRELARLPWGQAPGQRRCSSGHGRTESRSIKVIDLSGTHAEALFPRAARAIKVVRRRRRTAKNHSSTEIVYAVTSLGYRAADPGLLATWIQGHWAIENTVHYVRDVTQGEDHSTIRTGHGPQVMAALRNTANNIARLRGDTNMAHVQRNASWRPETITEAIHAA